MAVLRSRIDFGESNLTSSQAEHPKEVAKSRSLALKLGCQLLPKWHQPLAVPAPRCVELHL